MHKRLCQLPVPALPVSRRQFKFFLYLMKRWIQIVDTKAYMLNCERKLPAPTVFELFNLIKIRCLIRSHTRYTNI